MDSRLLERKLSESAQLYEQHDFDGAVLCAVLKIPLIFCTLQTHHAGG